MDNSLIGLLYPLHPKLVHFPIALMVSAMGMQALGVFLKRDSWCKEVEINNIYNFTFNIAGDIVLEYAKSLGTQAEI